MSSTTTNQNIEIDPEIKVKNFEQIFDLTAKTWQIMVVDTKEHQFSATKTYLWLNITFLVGAAGLLSLLISERCLSSCVTVWLLIFTIPSAYGLYLGIKGLSETRLKASTNFPCDFRQMITWPAQYPNIEARPYMIEGLINCYQDSIDSYRKLTAARASLLAKQNLWAMIAMLSLGLATIMCILKIGGS